MNKDHLLVSALLFGMLMALLLQPSIFGGRNAVLFAEDDEPQESGDSTVQESAETEKDEAGASEAPKTYSCPKCGFTTEEAGDCPGCNLSLSEGRSESGGDSAVSTDESGKTSARSGDDSAEISDNGAKANSGGDSASVSSDGSIQAQTSDGQSVEINGGNVNVNAGGSAGE